MSSRQLDRQRLRIRSDGGKPVTMPSFHRGPGVPPIHEPSLPVFLIQVLQDVLGICGRDVVRVSRYDLQRCLITGPAEYVGEFVQQLFREPLALKDRVHHLPARLSAIVQQ